MTDGPIAAATAELVSWLGEVSSGSVLVEPPADNAQGAGQRLCVWPLELIAEPELRNSRQREPMRFRVRHVVAGSTPLLDKAIVAATVSGSPTLDLRPLPHETWRALGCRPRVALLIDMPAVIARPTPQAPIVTEELRLDLAPKSALTSTEEA